MAAAKDEAAGLAGKQAAELDAERSRTAALTDELSALRKNMALQGDTDEEPPDAGARPAPDDRPAVKPAQPKAKAVKKSSRSANKAAQAQEVRRAEVRASRDKNVRTPPPSKSTKVTKVTRMTLPAALLPTQPPPDRLIKHCRPEHR